MRGTRYRRCLEGAITFERLKSVRSACRWNSPGDKSRLCHGAVIYGSAMDFTAWIWFAVMIYIFKHWCPVSPIIICNWCRLQWICTSWSGNRWTWKQHWQISLTTLALQLRLSWNCNRCYANSTLILPDVELSNLVQTYVSSRGGVNKCSVRCQFFCFKHILLDILCPNQCARNSWTGPQIMHQ